MRCVSCAEQMKADAKSALLCRAPVLLRKRGPVQMSYLQTSPPLSSSPSPLVSHLSAPYFSSPRCFCLLLFVVCALCPFLLPPLPLTPLLSLPLLSFLLSLSLSLSLSL